MPNMLHKLTLDAKDAISKAIAQAAVKTLIDATKAASDADTGTFKVIISTSDVDRHGEVVDINGWDLTNYKNNPVVLWSHDYCSLPIGICTAIGVENGQLVASGKFAPTEFAQEVRALYDLGIVRATSVGFIANDQNGPIITHAELLEFSFTPVPANPFCLSTLTKMGVNMEAFITKGLFVKDGEEPVAPVAPAPEVKPEEAPAEVKPEEVPAPAPAPEVKPEEVKAAATNCSEHDQPLKYCEDCVKDIIEEAKAKSIGEKSGRELSDKNRKILKDSIDAIKGAHDSLKSLHDATGSQGDDEKKVEEPAASVLDPLEALNKYLSDREMLRLINKVTSDALENINKRARTSNKQ